MCFAGTLKPVHTHKIQCFSGVFSRRQGHRTDYNPSKKAFLSDRQRCSKNYPVFFFY